MKLFLQILFKGSYYFLKNKNQREFMRLVFMYGDKPRYAPEKISFLNYTVDVPDCLSFVNQVKEIFADENYKFHSTNSAPVIYDCGANIGISCLYFKQLFPLAKIKAFEADPKITQLLLQNLNQNHINDVEVIAKAVWINDAGIEFSSEGADGSSVYSTGKKIKIESIKLKDILQSEQKIDLLKMDIEGAEIDVLRDCGDSLANVENIFVEYHSFVNNKQSLDEILQILSANGFRYFIKPEADRKYPFINRFNKNNPEMDLQINIFGYRNS
ncbi:MAG: FkbM family methyltransferase [Ignavibacteriales bacterium]|nr:FkbM family methyltransferase [Ignavibacteriales bacterium]